MLEDPLNERTIIFDSHKNMDHDETFVIVVEYNKTFIRGHNMQNQKQFRSLNFRLSSDICLASWLVPVSVRLTTHLVVL